MKQRTTGTIITSVAGFYDVATEHGTVRTRARGVFRKNKEKPVVGDHVQVELDGNQTNYLVKILPRRNFLKRPLLANVSRVILVISAVEPDFSLNLLDRFIIFFESEGINVELYLSKQDIVKPARLEEIKQALQYYARIGYPLLSYEGTTKAEILNLMEDEDILVLAGQSGAGKSTLLNKLKQDARQATAPISSSLNRGKHTTRQIELFTYGPGYIADTPGFSSIELHQIKLLDLVDYFRDFVAHAAECKFRGCQHLNEPGCAVKNLVASGEILQSRYDNYLTMRKEIEDNKLPEYRK
ncbi:ribosome biogenesis GTPase rsga [Amylolactobacillus amylotrophicus DSM 20534]|uniref:Ribosome small subunit-dependent GTPase A n=3 Tax=Amylolactobacillus TaxID=2767876 RepID=A0A1L6XAF8_9LACO|nr:MULTISPECIES: ribosome small subunit-dependent GTPase A [Amylolactobacillus]APT17923.1 ribosome small subunit-dependent GTPase A [Amylolactobacillus amylophilus DSM 20533 = JCM 1125]KRK38367.1 ribosome biogenesis GTPase rsga [Amylolactobacillus amylotrophicus DSM 20534]KRM42990.1 ribosome biogenesis GTPase rsga [Amylolactobacillus amylophilus DSM 20533 = JCM 1125]GED79859.1 putative ribosome biogenesis GTPase RsgA [Amylolactobacillus amylophilus]